MKTIKLKDDLSNLKTFENKFSDELKELFYQFQEEAENGCNYQELTDWQNTFAPYGLTFDFELSAEPFNFEIKY